MAVAVSLTAGVRANGTPRKGRFYLPTFGGGINPTTGLMEQTITDRVVDLVVDYVEALRGAGLDPGVWSRTEATFATLTMIRVGNKPDTIRTRRNAEPEEYSIRLV
jgi:hypothetical protein